MAAKSKSKPSNELKITRVYDAPVEAVWDAWADPAQAAKWWGPRGFTLTTHSKDLRPGGMWHYTMHGPDGTDWVNKTKYFEVEKHSRLVYDHGGNDERAPLFRVTVQFTPLKGKTRMEMTMTLPTVEAAEETRKFVKKAGGEATWDRLAEYLTKESSGNEQFVINRVFEAPVETVFEMWTNPGHFTRWLPPAGLKMDFIRADIRNGGKAFFVMKNDEARMYGTAEYLEITPHHRIVYKQQFCDENEKPSRHPYAPEWPLTMINTISFTEESPGRTRVTLVTDIPGPLTPAELKAFVDERGGMTRGWSGSFDKLEELLDAE